MLNRIKISAKTDIIVKNDAVMITDWSNRLSDLKLLDDLLKCPSCYDYMRTAMILPNCHHNFCSLCIRKYFCYKTQCPACSAPASGPELRNNRLLDSVIEQYQKLRKPLKEILKKITVEQDNSHSLATSKHHSQLNNSTCNSLTSQITLSEDSEVEIWEDKNGVDTKFTDYLSDTDFQETGPDKYQVRKSFENVFPNNTKKSVLKDARHIANDLQGITNISQQDSIETDELSCSTGTPQFDDSQPSCSTPISSQSNKVDCPVCGVSVGNEVINKHLDNCLNKTDKRESLRSSSKKKPLTKIVYHLMSDKDLKRKLKGIGLSTDGDRKELIKRHQGFTLFHNSDCDSLHPKSNPELVKSFEKNERMKRKLMESSKDMVLKIQKNSDENEIRRAQKSYAKQHKNQFQDLIKQARIKKLAKAEISYSNGISSEENNKSDCYHQKELPEKQLETSKLDKTENIPIDISRVQIESGNQDICDLSPLKLNDNNCSRVTSNKDSETELLCNSNKQANYTKQSPFRSREDTSQPLIRNHLKHTPSTKSQSPQSQSSIASDKNFKPLSNTNSGRKLCFNDMSQLSSQNNNDLSQTSSQNNNDSNQNLSQNSSQLSDSLHHAINNISKKLTRQVSNSSCGSFDLSLDTASPRIKSCTKSKNPTQHVELENGLDSNTDKNSVNDVVLTSNVGNIKNYLTLSPRSKTPCRKSLFNSNTNSNCLSPLLKSPKVGSNIFLSPGSLTSSKMSNVGGALYVDDSGSECGDSISSRNNSRIENSINTSEEHISDLWPALSQKGSQSEKNTDEKDVDIREADVNNREDDFGNEVVDDVVSNGDVNNEVHNGDVDDDDDDDNNSDIIPIEDIQPLSIDIIRRPTRSTVKHSLEPVVRRSNRQKRKAENDSETLNNQPTKKQKH